jgi:pimeloyl-[acyl-carrier protein] methyl ester esterase
MRTLADTMNPSLVLLPGLDGTGTQFAPFAARVSSAFPVNVISYQDGHVRYDEHVESVMAVLPRDRPYALVAESYSGPVAVQIAASRPVGLVAVVLCATFIACPRPLLALLRPILGVAPPWRVPAALLAPLLLGAHSTPELRQLLAQALRSTSPRVLLDRLRGVAQVDVTAAAAQVQVPCLYMRATDDRLVPRGASDLAKRHLRNLEVVELEGPHFLLQARAESAARVIEAFAMKARVS